MNVDPTTDAIAESGVVAVLRAQSAEHFAAVAEVLVDAGIRVLEVTLTSRGALQSLVSLTRGLPAPVRVGAGSVMNGDDAQACVDAGAAFLVSPVFDIDVLTVGLSAGIPTYPGALTPTEVVTASRAGAPAVKIFPASSLGPRYVKDLHGPLPGVRMMPTGGIAIDAIGDWLTAGAMAVGLGGPLLGDAGDGGSLQSLRDRARRAVDAVATARGSA